MTTMHYRTSFFRTLLCLAACLVMALAGNPYAGAQVSSPTTCHPVINEILTGTGTSGTEEFVELFNPCATAFPLDGWVLLYRTDTPKRVLGIPAPGDFFYSPVQGVLQPRGYLVFGGPGYHGPSSGALQNGIAADGYVGLFNGNSNSLIDAVGFGTTSVLTASVPILPGLHPYEGAPSPLASLAPSPGQSLSRSPNGVDSNNNFKDFKVTPPTPMAANPRAPGSGSTTPPPSPFSPPSPFLDSSGFLHACLNPSGQLRTVAPTTLCAAGEMKIHWLVVPDSPKP